MEPQRLAMKILNKASQLVSGGESSLYDKLPNANILCKYDKLSIKLDDQGATDRAISGFVFQKSVDFEPILFKITDRQSDTKQVVLHAALCSRRGFIVIPNQNLNKHTHGNPPHQNESTKSSPTSTEKLPKSGSLSEIALNTAIMTVALPMGKDTSYGKIEHPCGATVYKMSKPDNHNRINFVCTSGSTTCDSRNDVHTRLLAVAHCRSTRRLQLLKTMGVTFTNQRIDVVNPNGDTLGKIKPKPAFSQRSIMHVSFTSECCDQRRVWDGPLALALFKLLELAVDNVPLKNLLRESVYDPQQRS